VEIHEGAEALSPRTESETFLQEDFRLACQAIIEKPKIKVDFTPLRRVPKILTETRRRRVGVDAMVTRCGDTVLYDGTEIDQYRGHMYGLAIDVGTTTVVVELVDLDSGETVQLSAFENPQRFAGSDVMNRISYDGNNRGELWRAIVNAINYEIERMAEVHEFSCEEIYEVVVVGNSTMRDIFFRLDVSSIGTKPFKSATEFSLLQGDCSTTSLSASSRRLALKLNRSARIYSPPLIASHIGADIAAGLGAVDFEDDDRTLMFVDMGTNTEIVIRHGGRTVAASCPAGPAFEGGLVKYGMSGTDGAIDSIRYNGGVFCYTTIADVPPQGICGSGLIDLLAELRRHDQMSSTGLFADKKQLEIPVVPDCNITFSRVDASNLALAKAANYCGLFILMRYLGLNPPDIDKVYLAGAFANYIDIRNAVAIGLLPGVPEERIEKVGNAAAQGAREILLSRARRDATESFVRNIEHVELEEAPDFFDVFVDGCRLQPMPDRITDSRKLEL
jgi:uncharacterized 2Fe-2S/4Fe-4S cluster protein (DUF4445 family)